MDIKKLKSDELIKFIRNQISLFEPKKADMLQSIEYYNFKQDILNKKRFTIGKDGIKVIDNLPNARVIDNQFKKAIDQKVNYLFSSLPTVKADDPEYQKLVSNLYNKKFLRTINKIALESYLCGISWLYVANDNGKLSMTKMDATEIIPIWQDKNHESLEAVIRLYATSDMVNGELKTVDKLALYTDERVRVYKRDSFEEITNEGYLEAEDGTYFSFDKIPFVYFKSNSSEMPLLNRVKSLQDGINSLLSNFYDNMLEDPRNQILILKNYDGEDLGEFRQKLAQYGAVKVTSSADGADGGVGTLEVHVNSENYRLVLDLFKEKLIENAMAFDMKGYKSGTAPNELNIKSAYSDMELDAAQTLLEFSASLEYLEYFLKAVHGITDEDKVATVSFKRNLMVNEESIVNILNQSVGMISKKTMLAKHPFVEDVDEEIKALKDEEEEAMGDYTLNLDHDHDEEEHE